MSSVDQPYDALGRILVNGGDIALASAIYAGNQGRVDALFGLWGLWGATPAQIAYVEAIAEQAVAAGETVMALPDDADIDPQTIPQNVLLFGSEPAGRRGLISGEFWLPSASHGFRVDLEVADFGNKRELLEQFMAEATRRIKDSPTAFGLKSDATEEEIETIATFLIRKW